MGLTPSQLRELSAKNLERARRSLAAKDPDHAAYEAGHAVELALKARYCTFMQWADFPNDDKDRKARGGPDCVHHHDLQRLLRVSPNSWHIPHFANVQWDIVSDWDNQDRYKGIGHKIQEQAQTMLEESSQLIYELRKFDTAEALVLVEHAVSAQLGPFWLFAWSKERESPLEQVLWCAPWAVSKAAPWAASKIAVDAGQELIRRTIVTVVPADLQELVGPVRYVSPEEAWPFFMFGPPPGYRISQGRHSIIEGHFIENVYVIRSEPP